MKVTGRHIVAPLNNGRGQHLPAGGVDLMPGHVRPHTWQWAFLLSSWPLGKVPADKLDKMVSAKVFSDTKDSTALECIAEWEGVAKSSVDKEENCHNRRSWNIQAVQLWLDHCECNLSGCECRIDFLASRYTLIGVWLLPLFLCASIHTFVYVEAYVCVYVEAFTDTSAVVSRTTLSCAWTLHFPPAGFSWESFPSSGNTCSSSDQQSNQLFPIPHSVGLAPPVLAPGVR